MFEGSSRSSFVEVQGLNPVCKIRMRWAVASGRRSHNPERSSPYPSQLRLVRAEPGPFRMPIGVTTDLREVQYHGYRTFSLTSSSETHIVETEFAYAQTLSFMNSIRSSSRSWLC